MGAEAVVYMNDGGIDVTSCFRTHSGWVYRLLRRLGLHGAVAERGTTNAFVRAVELSRRQDVHVTRTLLICALDEAVNLRGRPGASRGRRALLDVAMSTLPPFERVVYAIAVLDGVSCAPGAEMLRVSVDMYIEARLRSEGMIRKFIADAAPQMEYSQVAASAQQDHPDWYVTRSMASELRHACGPSFREESGVQRLATDRAG